MSEAGSSSDHRERLKQAILTIRKLQGRVRQLERAAREPIAIVGMGCRFPGGASNPDRFWRLLESRQDAVTEVPADRWSRETFYDRDPEVPGKMYTLAGGFLDDVDRFDADFFRISPREAAKVDPQQRLLLEVTWEALEEAGIPPDALLDSRTGVFVGVSTHDYLRKVGRLGHAAIDAYSMTGLSPTFAAGRISFTLGLKGPSLVVDTACSSSLVAIHLGVQALRAGDADQVIAGGVNAIVSPEHTIACCKARMLSPTGRCRTFDSAADGFIRSEGCGLVVLRRLSDAQRSSAPIRAVIRGSAVNQDGATSGLTVPDRQSQEAVIRQALDDAGLAPADIGLIEAHGTGTPLGDPIELRGLANIFGAGDRGGAPLRLGSVKSNIGHAEAAAGVAGLIKVVLAMQRGSIPPNLHVNALTERFEWEGTPFEVPTEPTSWPAGDRPRRAGISSFGASGTNAHLIVEDWATEPDEAAAAASDRSAHVLCLSARTATALRELARRYDQTLASSSAADVANVCYSAAIGRNHFDQRLGVVGGDAQSLCEELRRVATGSASARAFRGEAAAPPRVAFLFSGQGSQYVGMGRDLYGTQPTFRAAIDRCGALLDAHLEAPLTDVLFTDAIGGDRIDDTRYTQPALFALEYALAQLWMTWGVVPEVMLGHSVGELVAACVAGMMSLEDALELVAARGHLMSRLPPGGAMAAALAPPEVVEQAVAGLETLSIAARNGPRNTVISGAAQSVEEAIRRLAGEGVEARRLTVSHAFHSSLVEPILDDLAATASARPTSTATRSLVSNLTGERIRPGERLPDGYWRRHAREAVQFERGMATLNTLGVDVFVEVGPGTTLLGMGRQCLPEHRGLWLPSLRRGRDAWAQLLESVAQLYTAGAELDWAGFDADYPRRRVSLPTYPFDRQRHWVDVPDTLGAAASPREATPTPAAGGLYELTWRPSPASPPRAGDRPPVGSRRWVVFAAADDSEGLVERLERAGETVHCVLPGDGFRRSDDGHYVVRPHLSRDFVAVLSECLEGQEPARLVFAWGLEEPERELSGPTLLADLPRLCRSLLYLVQALEEVGSGPGSTLVIVTRGAEGPETTARGLAQCPLWGLGRVLALERPALATRLVDLGPEAGPEDAERLLAELQAVDRESAVANGRGIRLVARLARYSRPTRPMPIRADGAYLVTGGLGGLGLEVGRWLAERGAAHVALMGRRPPSPATSVVLDALRATGTRVTAVQGDVGVEDDVRRAIESCESAGTPLRGVFHSAGVTDDGVLSDLTWSQFERVMRAKVSGSWLLHELTQGRPLDIFALFSSVASLLGAAGQANYAAANAFLDGLARWRRGRGLPATSIHWGPWAEVGMFAEGGAAVERTARALGLAVLTTTTALAGLERAIASEAAEIGVFEADWAAYRRGLPRGAPNTLAADLLSDSEAGIESPADGELLDELRACAPRRRKSLLTSALRAAIGAVLGREAEAVSPTRGFRDLGMDSLMALELRNRLEGLLGRGFPATIAFDHPNLEALTTYLLEQTISHPDARPSSSEGASPKPDREPEVPEDLAAMSDEEAERQLLAELGLLGEGSDS